ncbi:MAG: ABC transporter ATP-binding protein [Candidatus Dehalobacter alkaniphilus]|uniref:ABC transporter ATP-binding protein n=1 Tax=Dehalobacter sp. DCM TaxID=2907827 RepID=UPI003081DBB4|nr:ABC transporter ATP-binding protein [Dehalobacter sp. DCM]
MCAITIEHLSYSYIDHHESYLALDSVDLQIHSGEFVCLIGHSGCGKTTLLKVLAGLLSPSAGGIYIDDQLVNGPGTERAVVFQHYSLFPWMTVQDNVVFGIRQAKKNIPKKEAGLLAEEYLLKVGMEDFSAKYPYQLSGGMQQRVAIARALAMDAEILLLDEPFGALDTKRRSELQRLLAHLWDNGKQRKTVVFVTHDIDEAIILADRIVFMRPGKIAACLRVPYARPRKQEDLLKSTDYERLKADLQQLFYLDQELKKHEEDL